MTDWDGKAEFLVPDFVENPENRCPVILLLDASASMAGAPIEALNAGVAAYFDEIARDEAASLRVETAIIAIGDSPRLVRDFATIDEAGPSPVLDAWGKTPIGASLELGLRALETRKALYRAHGVHYYRPWMFLITDGAPTDGILWQEAAQKIQEADMRRKLAFFTIGVEGADFSALHQIAAPSRPPLALKELRFKEFFFWLSASMRQASAPYAGHHAVPLPPVDSWAGDGWTQVAR